MSFSKNERIKNTLLFINILYAPESHGCTSVKPGIQVPEFRPLVYCYRSTLHVPETSLCEKITPTAKPGERMIPIRFERVCPFPHISVHIETPIWTGTFRIAADRLGSLRIHVRFCGIVNITPGPRPAVLPLRCFLPFFLGGEAFSRPCRVGRSRG